MKIGIFGGTFNPIHLGHLIMASYAYEEMDLDKIIFMPAGNPPMKEGEISFFHRKNMIELSIKDDPRFSYSELEDRDGLSYSYETIKEIRKFSSDELYFIMGADSFESIHKWYEYEKLLKEIEIIVVDRKGSSDLDGLKEDYRAVALGIHILKGPIIDISSSLIRSRIKEKRSIRYLLAKEVREYIEKHRLYR